MMFSNSVRRTLLLPRLTRSPAQGGSRNLQDHAADALARVIGEVRQQAIADGVRPIPGAIIRSLTGFFPETLLRRSRYSVSDAGPLTLPALGLVYGEPSATTLIDVLIVRTERTAQSDLKLWAGSLTRIMQFERWGLDEFTRRYVGDRAVIEQEIACNVARFVAWARYKQV